MTNTPYGDAYYTELNRLTEAQNKAAQMYTSQMLYMREQLYMRNDKLRTERAEQAAREWLQLDAEISALNSAERAKGTG